MTTLAVSACELAWLLLAQASNWSHLGDRFSGRGARVDTGELTTLVLVVAGAAALIGGLAWFSRHGEGWLRRPNPDRLFRDLCETHQLGRAEQSLLRALAGHAGVHHPAELFVRPEFFRQEAAPKELAPQRKAIAALRQALFADLIAKEQQADTLEGRDAETDAEEPTLAGLHA